MEYLSAGKHGTLAEQSRTLAAVARGDQAPDTVLHNGTVVNVHTGELQSGMDLVIAAGRIARVRSSVPQSEYPSSTTIVDVTGQYLAPGFIDTHVHYESSMVTATGFCRGVVPHGTTAAFMDPHEIGNVLGIDGIRTLLDEAQELPLKTFCTIPSCVPAAPGFEDSGAVIDAEDIAQALQWDDVLALGEMMNYPGTIAGDEAVHDKLAATYRAGLPATGHYASPDYAAPLDAYVATGVSSDHESVHKEGALAKLRKGLWTQLRQGSAWQDIPTTIKAITESDVDTRHLLLVTDDIHPDTLVEEGHLDRVLRVAIRNGLDPITAIQAVTLNAAEYYNVQADLGALSPGKIADVVVLDDLATVAIDRVLINGRVVTEAGEWLDEATSTLPSSKAHTAAVQEAFPTSMRQTVAVAPPAPKQFTVSAPTTADTVTAEVIRVHEHQAGTTREQMTLPVVDGAVTPTASVSKAAVIERHGTDGSMGRGFVTGFGFEQGAVASTVAHDSHNLLVVGTNDTAMAAAADAVITEQGGWAAVDDDGAILASVPLSVAGLMSDKPLSTVATEVQELEAAFRHLGCDIASPFMTMSLLPLAVLPELRLTNRGLVDTVEFEYCDLLPNTT